jgi:LysR family transcriptional regulator for bpeEF and oprC
MDRFEAMRAFVHVLESGSFTKAAQQLNLHKASVSQQIQQLEDKLGARLLTRSTRSVTPTAEGLAYYRHACEILQQVDEVESQLRKGVSAPTGHLRVNVPSAMGRLVFATELRDFLERHPKITLELACTDRAVDLVQEGLDCVLRGAHLPDSSLSARKVGKLRFVLCAAPRYISAHGNPQTPEELMLKHHQVGFLAATSGKLRRLQLQAEGQLLDLDVPARFVTSDSAVALSAGLDGMGIVQLAEFVASPYLSSAALVPVLPAWQCPSLPLHLVTPSSRKRATRVLAFMDWAQSMLHRRLGTFLDEHGPVPQTKAR